MPIQSRTIPGEQIFDIELIYEPIFDALSPAALLRVALACRTAHHAVSSYIRIAFNINRLLSRFFPSPTAGCSIGCCRAHTHDEEYARVNAFRSLQARTGTLISGSAALQFFERTVWPESDLDLYVHPRHRREVARWLAVEGYTYKPAEFQSPRLEDEVTSCITRVRDLEYSIPGVLTVLTFVKPLPKAEGEAQTQSLQSTVNLNAPNINCSQELKVQLIIAENTPMEVILGFHSTCVMNVISYEKAYCLFPRATLEERSTLVSSSCRGVTFRRVDGLAKYEQRGYKLVYTLPSHEVTPNLNPSTAVYVRREGYPIPPIPSTLDLTGISPLLLSLRISSVSTPTTGSDLLTSASTSRPVLSPAFRLGWRWIDDSASWVLPLPLTGVTPPLSVNMSTTALTHDPVAVCNWEVYYQPGGATMRFEVAGSGVLRYQYILSDGPLIAFLMGELSTRKCAEDVKYRAQLEDWTFYDSELRALCREFLRGLASRHLSCLDI